MSVVKEVKWNHPHKPLKMKKTRKKKATSLKFDKLEKWIEGWSTAKVSICNNVSPIEQKTICLAADICNECTIEQALKFSWNFVKIRSNFVCVDWQKCMNDG